MSAFADLKTTEYPLRKFDAENCRMLWKLFWHISCSF